jgi:hypothetical protein
MRSELIVELLQCLERLAEHPEWIRKEVQPGQELSYISGVGLGVRFILDLVNDPRGLEFRRTATVTRGWETDRHPYEQMLERGFSADDVLSELVRLEIEFIRLASE